MYALFFCQLTLNSIVRLHPGNRISWWKPGAGVRDPAEVKASRRGGIGFPLSLANSLLLYYESARSGA